MVHKSHYEKDLYDNPSRFSSYFAQIKAIVDRDPETVLEVGVGNKTVLNYLKERGIKTTSVDIEESLTPDILADVRDLPLDDESFDVTTAFEVLEHLPYEDVINKAIPELTRVSKKYVCISVPFSCFYTEIQLNMRIPKKSINLSLPIRIPYFFSTINPDNKDGHFWELGRRTYSKSRLLNDIQATGLELIETYHVAGVPFHFFMIFRK